MTTWGDFLGTDNHRLGEAWPFENTRDFVRKLGFTTIEQFQAWARSPDRLRGVPSNPNRAYVGKGWTNWGDFLGTGKNSTVRARDNELRSYDKTSEFVRAKGIKSKKEYDAWAKSDDKPNDIPTSPNSTYKNKGWTSWGDFLGTDNHNLGEAWPFDKTRGFVREREFRTVEQFQAWARSLDRPRGVPSSPDRTYAGKGWTSWGDFLGTGKKPNRRGNGEWRDYDDVVKIVREAGIRSQAQFNSWDRPDGVPSNPHVIYEGKGWTTWGGFFGTDYQRNIECWTYAEAYAYVQGRGFKSVGEFNEASRSGKLPKGMPSAPDRIFAGKGWTGWPDFLGTRTFRGELPPWEEYRADIRSRGFKNVTEFRAWNKDRRPNNFPSNPQQKYRGKGFTNWPDLIGSGHQRGGHWPFKKACAYIRPFKFKSKDDFYEWGKTKSRPPGLPTNPQRTYAGKGWKGWSYFLRGAE